MRGAERGIAIDDALGDHAQSDQVVDLGELLTFALHLLIDRPVVLGAARDLIALDTGALQLVVECLDGLGQEALAGLAALMVSAKKRSRASRLSLTIRAMRWYDSGSR